MYHETHPNPNEIFPLKGKLGAPGGFAKTAAALAASAVLATAVVLLLALSVFCTALSILPTRADIEVRLENWDETPVLWDLGYPEDTRPTLQTGTLTRRVTVLALEELTPDTWYELRFYEQGDSARENPVGHFRFRTGSGTVPPVTQPSATRPSATQPSVTQSMVTQPPATEPTATQPPVPEPTVTQPPVTEPTVTQPTVTEPILPVPPTAQTPVLESYISPMLDGSGYTIRFRFDLNDGLPRQITVTDTVTTYSNFDPEYGNQGPTETVQTTVTRVYTPADMVVDPATNTATVAFPAEDPYKGHSLTARLDYTLQNADGSSAGDGWVESPVYTAAPSYLYGQEVSANTTWSAAVNGDRVDVTLTIRDFQKGSMEYALSHMNIYVDYDSGDNYASYELAQLTQPPALPAESGGVFTYRFTIPLNPDGWAEPPRVIYLSMDAAGDCVLDGAPMGMPSETFAYGRVYTVETYSVAAPTLAFSREFLGLKLDTVEMGGSGDWGSSLAEVLPGDEVYVYIYFSGTATADAVLSPNITAPGGITVETEPCEIRQGDSWLCVTLWFTMPEGDVGSIVIGEFTLELQQ